MANTRSQLVHARGLHASIRACLSLLLLMSMLIVQAPHRATAQAPVPPPWQPIPLITQTLLNSGNAFALDPRNANRLIGVGGNSGDIANNNPHGLYLSTDKGASWQQVLPRAEGYLSPDSIAYDLNSYNATLGYCTTVYFASGTGGLWKTTDGGTFSLIAGSGLPPAGSALRGITVSPANANYMSLWSDYTNQDNWFRGYSTDGGLTGSSRIMATMLAITSVA